MLARSKSSASNKAFSLVEILVVAAILAILMALAIPSFGQALQKMRATQCNNHLRSWMVALQMYTSENNNKLPPSKWVNGSSADATDYLYPYMGRKSKSEAWDLDTCPIGLVRDAQTGASAKWGSYGFNSFVTEMQQTLIADPARLIYASDLAATSRWIGYSTIFGGKPGDLTGAVPKPHQRQINVAYLDGHIASRYVSQLVRADFTRYTSQYSVSDETKTLADPSMDR